MCYSSSDVAFPEKYYPVCGKFSGNFPERKIICSLFFYILHYYIHVYRVVQKSDNPVLILR